MHWVRDLAHERMGDEALALLSVLAGNAPMDRKTRGARGLPVFHRACLLRSFTVPLLRVRKPAPPGAGPVVDRAKEADLDDMDRLWRQVAPTRAFAPATPSHAAWLAGTPGLSVEDFLVARHAATNELLGFVGLWDQSSFKQLRVTRYSVGGAFARMTYNALGRLYGAPRLPKQSGLPLACRTATHVCVRDAEPATLRALLASAYAWLRAEGYPLFTIALDVADPLCEALASFWTQPTDVDVYLARLTDEAPPELALRPVHYEIALA